MTNKEIADLRREQSELELKRTALKEKALAHRADATIDELNGVLDELNTIDTRASEIQNLLKDAGNQQEKRGNIDMVVNDLTKENFRASSEYRDAFYRSFINGKVGSDDAEVMAFGKRAITDMNGGSVTSGAEYLVPQTTLTQIKSVMVKYGALYAAVTKYNFNGDVTIPIGTAGSVTNESNGTDTLTFTFTEVAINQQAVVATITVKNLLLKNAIAGIETYLAMEIGKYIGLQLENYVLNGNPSTSKFQGIINAYGSADTYSEVDWDLINDVYGGLESPYGDDGTWIMNRKTFFGEFRSLTDANGRPLIESVPVTVGGAGRNQFFIDGRPVILSTRMADGAFVYGDLSQYVVNESQDIVIEADASAGFAADSTVWRGKVYSGGKVLFIDDAFKYYTKTA